MLYKSKHISRPIFLLLFLLGQTFSFATVSTHILDPLICPGTNFHIATVRAHILDHLNQTTNYFNDTKVKYPVNVLCQLTNHHCLKKHTQLIRFDKILCISVVTTPAGKTVTATKPLTQHCTAQYWLYNFKNANMS